jgi:hypothetical protein
VVKVWRPRKMCGGKRTQGCLAWRRCLVSFSEASCLSLWSRFSMDSITRRFATYFRHSSSCITVALLWRERFFVANREIEPRAGFSANLNVPGPFKMRRNRGSILDRTCSLVPTGMTYCVGVCLTWITIVWLPSAV